MNYRNHKYLMAAVALLLLLTITAIGCANKKADAANLDPNLDQPLENGGEYTLTRDGAQDYKQQSASKQTGPGIHVAVMGKEASGEVYKTNLAGKAALDLNVMGEGANGTVDGSNIAGEKSSVITKDELVDGGGDKTAVFNAKGNLKAAYIPKDEAEAAKIMAEAAKSGAPLKGIVSGNNGQTIVETLAEGDDSTSDLSNIQGIPSREAAIKLAKKVDARDLMKEKGMVNFRATSPENASQALWPMGHFFAWKLTNEGGNLFNYEQGTTGIRFPFNYVVGCSKNLEESYLAFAEGYALVRNLATIASDPKSWLAMTSNRVLVGYDPDLDAFVLRLYFFIGATQVWTETSLEPTVLDDEAYKALNPRSDLIEEILDGKSNPIRGTKKTVKYGAKSPKMTNRTPEGGGGILPPHLDK